MKNKKRNARKVRYAVVGLGHLAQVAVLPAFARLQNSEIAALVTSDKRKARILARRYRVKDVYDYPSMKSAWLMTSTRFTSSCPTISTANSPYVPRRPVYTSCVKSPWRSASRSAAR